MSQSKLCTKCGETKPLDLFSKATRNKDGKQHNCKQCNADYVRDNQERIKAYKKANSAKMVEASRVRRQLNPEKYKEYDRNRYHNNKDAENLRSAIYHFENKEKIAQRKAEWRQNNKDLVVQGSLRRRAQKREVEKCVITRKDLRRLYNQPCLYCGATDKKITLDHAIPLTRGGRHGIGNLVPACLSCNSRKRTKTIMEFRMHNIRMERARYEQKP